MSLAPFIEVLHTKNLKATAQRIEILKILTQSRNHPTAEEVYRQAKSRFPTISPATVYKTIQALKEAGKVQELAFYEKKTRFDANTQPHINAVCLKCGKIQDVIDPKVEEFIKHVSHKLTYKLEGQRIDFYGICDGCQHRTRDRNLT